MVIKDRTREFMTRSAQYDGARFEDPSSSARSPRGDKFLYCEGSWSETSQFLDRIEVVRENVATLAIYVREIKQREAEMITKPAAEVEPDAKQKLDEVLSALKKLMLSVRQELKRLEVETDDTERDRKIRGQKTSANVDLRIRKAHLACLSEQVMEFVREYGKEQSKFMDDCRKRIYNYVQTTNQGELSPEEIDIMIDSGNLYQNRLIQDNQRAKQVMDEVKAREVALKQLEGNIMELNDMWKDLAILVEEQGESVTRIENNVDTAAVQVDSAHKDLIEAEKKVHAYRKKKVICTILIIVAILILVAVIVGSICGNGGC